MTRITNEQREAIVREAVAQRDAALSGADRTPKAVYLVATGETHDGRETYTRHDTYPFLCDAEKLYTRPEDHQALLMAARAVAFSNGFDAGLPQKLEALRAAVEVPARGWMGETGGFPDDSDRYPEDALIAIEKLGFALQQARKALVSGDRNDVALAVMEIDAALPPSQQREPQEAAEPATEEDRAVYGSIAANYFKDVPQEAGKLAATEIDLPTDHDVLEHCDQNGTTLAEAAFALAKPSKEASKVEPVADELKPVAYRAWFDKINPMHWTEAPKSCYQREGFADGWNACREAILAAAGGSEK